MSHIWLRIAVIMNTEGSRHFSQCCTFKTQRFVQALCVTVLFIDGGGVAYSPPSNSSPLPLWDPRHRSDDTSQFEPLTLDWQVSPTRAFPTGHWSLVADFVGHHWLAPNPLSVIWYLYIYTIHGLRVRTVENGGRVVRGREDLGEKHVSAQWRSFVTCPYTLHAFQPVK